MTIHTLFAADESIGAVALWLTYLWLASAIVAAYLSSRKGYGERPGLASGLLLNFIGVIVWLVVPPKPESLWRTVGWRGSKVRETEPAGYHGDGSNS